MKTLTMVEYRLKGVRKFWLEADDCLEKVKSDLAQEDDCEILQGRLFRSEDFPQTQRPIFDALLMFEEAMTAGEGDMSGNRITNMLETLLETFFVDQHP